MNIGKLSKSLKKEATKNPKKLAFLGIMFLVAIYFWAPLLMKWFGGEKNNTPARAALEVESSSPPKKQAYAKTLLPNNNTTAQKSQQTEFQWDKWKESMDRDQFMKPAELTGEIRNPFQQVPQDELARAKNGKQSNQGNQTSLDFGALGLKLDSTLVGRNSVAIINGKSYREKSKIKLKPGQNITGSNVVLEQVHPHHVILLYNKKHYQLHMERTTLNAGDAIFVKRIQDDIN